MLCAVHLTSQYPPVGQGGLGTHVLGLTQALAREIAIEIVSPTRLPGDPLDPQTALEWGLAVDPVAGTVLHAHNYEVALPALIAKALTGAPLVVTLHLPAPERYRGLEERLLKSADTVIAVSASLAAEYQERGAELPAPMVIPNGIDADFYRPDAGTRREGDTLLFAGRLAPQKGVDLAIRALRELLPDFPTLQLHIAGAGPWEQAYRNLARRLGVEDRVHWLGWLEPAELREEYRRCTAFLMPSRFEPFGLSALEAMACGAPVVASATGGLPEFITDGVTGLLASPSDPTALSGRIRDLLVNPKRAAQLGTAGAAHAASFTWERAAAATLQLYRSLERPADVPQFRPEERRARGQAVLDAALGEATDER
jgi:glycosyltransferase involved in cell wall biosynthesis